MVRARKNVDTAKTASDNSLHKWAWRARFKRAMFTWDSEPAIARIKEAVDEIKEVANIDGTLGANGAVLFLEKISPAIELTDNSSGRLSGAVCDAIDEFVTVINSAEVTAELRREWLEKLWTAMVADQKHYLETLGDYWGDLCHSTDIASEWADRLLATSTLSSQNTIPCLSALLQANRHDEIFEILKADRHRLWDYQQFAARALANMGRVNEALAFANEHSGWHLESARVARTCEQILIEAGRKNEAYKRYAIVANRHTSNIATFRSIKQKYSEVNPTKVLRDLISASAGEEGTWFATAKELKQLDLAIKLAETSPCDVRTLARACSDYRETNPDFAVRAGIAALRWLIKEKVSVSPQLDPGEIFELVMEAAEFANQKPKAVKKIRDLVKIGLTENSETAQRLADIV